MIAAALRWASTTYSWPWITMGAVLALFVSVIVIGIGRQNTRYAEYLADCMEHRPRYECVLLWRQSQPRDSDAPIIIPVPMTTR